MATHLRNSIVAATAALAGGSGVLSAYVVLPQAKIVLSTIGVFLLTVSALCAVVAPIAEKLADLFNWRASGHHLSLEDTREKVKNALKKRSTPVVVVIDDIDRLDREEIRIVMQLVKVNADLPKLVYLLPYHKAIVARALGRVAPQKGEQFLRKIVQVELQVPFAPEDKLLTIFQREVEPLLSQSKSFWDRDRWEAIFPQTVWPYFRTPRDIKRFSSSLGFYIKAQSTKGVLDVNPVDLILLEVLRTFDFEAYEAVSRAFQKKQDCFLAALLDDKQAKDRFVGGIADLLNRGLPQEEKTRLSNLLADLFPQSSKSFSFSNAQVEQWQFERRICHPKCFSRYFQVAPSRGEISPSYVADLLAPGQEAGRVMELLKEKITPEAFQSLVELLRASRDRMHPDAVEPLVLGFFQVSDSLPQIRVGLLSSTPELEIARLTALLLTRFDEPDRFASALRKCISSSQAVTGPALCLQFLSSSKDIGGTVATVLSQEATLESFRQLLLPRLWTAADEGRLWSMRQGQKLLLLLSEWAGKKPFRKWLAGEIENPNVATAYLKTSLKEAEATGGGQTYKIFTLAGKKMERFVNLERLLELLPEKPDGELERAAKKALARAVQHKRANQDYSKEYVISQIETGAFRYEPMDAL